MLLAFHFLAGALLGRFTQAAIWWDIWRNRERWIPVYQGPYSGAKRVISLLEAKGIPVDLTFSDEDEGESSKLVVRVLTKYVKEAKSLIHRQG